MYGDDLIAWCDKLRANAQEFLDQCGKKDMEIYRIENFTPVPIEEKYFGQFYDGDSYVCIVKGKKQYDIHFWEGKESSSDETGSAAALTD